MTPKPPFIRVLYQFTCSCCGAEECTRWPYSPTVQAPGILEDMPQGWVISLGGDSPQTPTALCPKCQGRAQE